MKLDFPSRDFDDVVADVCHSSVSEEQARALNALLRSNAAARDEYILRVELHARLASAPDLFVAAPQQTSADLENVVSLSSEPLPRRRAVGRLAGVVALAACLALIAGVWWLWHVPQPDERKGATSNAVAMLSSAVDAHWNSEEEAPRPGAPIEPRWLRLKSGLAQVVFYSGARVVLEGPAELQIISPSEAFCPLGRLTSEVPPQARGFQIRTRQMTVTDLGTVFGLEVKERTTEVHVFKGNVEALPAIGASKQNLQEGSGAVAEQAGSLRPITANAARFASLFALQEKSVAAESSRHDQWRAASRQLNEEPSLLVHYDFEHAAPSDWRLHNASRTSGAMHDGTIVGCQWGEGRWPSKSALEFRSVSDRVRLNVPGEFESWTMAAWIRVQGLDREVNSLFMSDGFDAGTLHWLIREDGVLVLTVIGQGTGNYQIVTSRPVLTPDQFGMWLHLAVVLDGDAKRVSHFLNGELVSEKALRIRPPFRIGSAELGNWNGRGFPKDDPFMIRNFSGAMDEFCLFSRALSPSEIHALYASDRSPPASGAAR